MAPNERKKDSLASIHSVVEVLQKLNTATDAADVCQHILSQTAKLLSADGLVLWLTDEADKMTVKAVHGLISENAVNTVTEPDKGVIGKVMHSKEACITTLKTGEFETELFQTKQFQPQEMMTVMLIIQQNVLGALQVFIGGTEKSFTADDLTIAKLMADQSALTLHNSQMYDDLYTMFMSMIRTLAETLDARDPLTKGHSERVARYAWMIGKRLKLDAKTCAELYRAAILHDIGKIGIEDRILQKAAGLTEAEYELMKKHTEIGARILETVRPERLFQNAVDTARYHHERMDGSGYPYQLAGETIPLFARIVGVADAFDAMTSVRTYSKGKTTIEAAEELERCKDTLFDKQVVEAFIEILEECQYQLEGIPQDKIG